LLEKNQMFVDEAKIFVKGGRGGNGAVSFLRLKYQPKGGPDGGDGGRGGDIILRADEGMHTLMDFRYRRHYKAKKGKHGEGKNKNGARGENLSLRVPAGTLVKSVEGNVLADLTHHGDEVVVASGGLGGKGNAHLVSPTRRLPRFAEKGEEGEELWINLELKLLAEVGIIGYPNVGKSTLISRISAARPKIAEYPFTTTVPNLGVVYLPDGRSFVAADVPGLIEGAHRGVGLGIDFLRHVDRSAILLHLLDLSGREGRDPRDDFEVVNRELELYHSRLAQRPQIVAGNKLDLPEARDNLERVRQNVEGKGYRFYAVSAVTGEGLEALLYALADELQQVFPRMVAEEAPPRVAVFTLKEEKITVEKENGVFEVRGKKIERMVAMTDFENDEAVAYLQERFEAMHLDELLKEAGIQEGDTVKIGKMTFDFHPS
jgi:GTP-binding protein